MTEQSPTAIEDAALAYLEKYGQPQTVAAIATALRGEFDHYRIEQSFGFLTPDGMDANGEAAVAARLDQMAAAGRIKEVRAGVHANGEETLEYAPLSFEG